MNRNYKEEKMKDDTKPEETLSRDQSSFKHSFPNKKIPILLRFLRNRHTEQAESPR